jgi:mannobiose 2-epimerase
MTLETTTLPDPGTTEDAERSALADRFDAYLERHVVRTRYPVCIDRDGWGFHARFDRTWQPLGEPTRFAVYQARTAWTAAHLLERRPALAELVAPAASHGLAAIERLWDEEHGGFFHRLRLDGTPEPPTAPKHLYSQAFALLALAALGRAAPRAEERARALALARRAFEHLEHRFRAADRPGYFSTLERDGRPHPFDPRAVLPPRDGFGGPSAWHDLNSHLHLLEAYVELQASDPRPEHAARLGALVDLVAGPFFAEPGCLHQLLDAGGRPVPGGVSFGHDIEAARLLLEAADLLGRRDPGLELQARRLAEHSLALGWDPHVGVWTECGGALEKGASLAAGWWVAVEAMATLFDFAGRFPDHRQAYERGGRETWEFVRGRLTDDEHHGVWLGYDARGHLLREKSGDWCSSYHSARALVLAADRLRQPVGG